MSISPFIAGDLPYPQLKGDSHCTLVPPTK